MNIKKEFEKFSADCGVRKSVTRDYQNSMTPNILEERNMNVTQMDVFSRLMRDRIIFLGNPINAEVANVIQAQLLFLSNLSNDDIVIYIASPGGAIYYGLGIYDTMKFIEPNVKTCCVSLAASMGSVLLAGGEKGKRSALPNARVMIHQPLGSVDGQASDIEIEAKEITYLKEQLYSILATNTNQSIDKIRNDSNRNYYLSSTEAKEYGIIDKVINYY